VEHRQQYVGFGGRRRELAGGISSGRERLVRHHVHARPHGLEHQLASRFRRRGDGHGVDTGFE
jgi:hypothetical protein